MKIEHQMSPVGYFQTIWCDLGQSFSFVIDDFIQELFDMYDNTISCQNETDYIDCVRLTGSYR